MSMQTTFSLEFHCCGTWQLVNILLYSVSLDFAYLSNIIVNAAELLQFIVRLLKADMKTYHKSNCSFFKCYAICYVRGGKASDHSSCVNK